MLKIIGLRKACNESRAWCHSYYSAEYLQLSYDMRTGHCWTKLHVSLGHNSWTVYHDKDVVNCGNITRPMTMREIREMIEDAVNRRREYDD